MINRSKRASDDDLLPDSDEETVDSGLKGAMTAMEKRMEMTRLCRR